MNEYRELFLEHARKRFKTLRSVDFTIPHGITPAICTKIWVQIRELAYLIRIGRFSNENRKHAALLKFYNDIDDSTLSFVCFHIDRNLGDIVIFLDKALHENRMESILYIRADKAFIESPPADMYCVQFGNHEAIVVKY